MRIMAIDPGSHTGVIMGDTESGEFKADEIMGSKALKWHESEGLVVLIVRKLCKEFQPEVVVIEDFALRPSMVSTSREVLSACRVGFTLAFEIGEMYPHVPGGLKCDLVWSQPSSMAVMSNDRLHEAGFWVEGSEHCRDAMRHWLIYCRKNGIKPSAPRGESGIKAKKEKWQKRGSTK